MMIAQSTPCAVSAAHITAAFLVPAPFRAFLVPSVPFGRIHQAGSSIWNSAGSIELSGRAILPLTLFPLGRCVSLSGRRSGPAASRTSCGAVGRARCPRAARGGAGRSGAPGPALPSRHSDGASPTQPGQRGRRQPVLPSPAQVDMENQTKTPKKGELQRGSPQASGMSSEPSSSSSPQCPGSAPPPSSLHLPESRRPRERSPSPLRGYLIPSPLPTRRTRTFSATVRASEGPIYKGVCKCFCRSKGHGFITPADGGPDIFVHISDIEGEYVPVAGDEVTYKMCTIPPKNEKLQAVEVVITHLAPGTKHETWSGHVISS